METTTETRSATEPVAAQTVDCSGLKCPLPIYKASMALKTLAAGEVLELICTDRGSLADIPVLARQTGNELLRTHENDGTQTFWLRKAG